MFQQREELLLLVFLHVVQDAGAGDVLGVHLAGSQIQALLPDLLIHNNTLSQVAGTGSSGALARAGDMAALFLRGGSISSGYAVIKLGLDLLFLAEQVRIWQQPVQLPWPSRSRSAPVLPLAIAAAARSRAMAMPEPFQ